MIGITSRAKGCLEERAPVSGLFLRLRRLIDDRRGVGAVEFAIVAPVLVMTYIGAFEISVAVSMTRKISRAASTVSDLLTRSDSTNKATLDTMKDVTKNVLAPFSQDGYTLKITGVAVDASGNATVAWSWDQSKGTPYTKGSKVTLPPDVDVKDTFVVRTEFIVPHKILLMAPGLSSQINTISIPRTSYFRKRVGDKITCTDC